MRQSHTLPLPLALRLGQRVFAGCGQPLLGVGLSRRYLCESFLPCLDPYPGGSESALTRFFLSDIGLSCVRTRSALHKFPCSDLSTDPYFGAAVICSCLGPPVCSPPRSLLPLCDDAASSCTRRILALRVPPLACTSFTGQPWLFHLSNVQFVASLYVRYASRPNRAIDDRGLAPHKIRSLVGCSPNGSVFSRAQGRPPNRGDAHVQNHSLKGARGRRRLEARVRPPSR